MPPEKSITRLDRIESAILLIRGARVMLDTDLAALYGVPVKALNQAIKRNRRRFPGDFMFQLSAREAASLRSRTVTLKRGRGRHRKYLPYAFTEHGVAMLSSVLRSARAVRVNIAIMRAFVKLRQLAGSHADLKQKVDTLEKKYDSQFKAVFDAIRALMEPEPTATRRIGFRTEEATDKLGVRTPRTGSPGSPSRPRPAASPRRFRRKDSPNTPEDAMIAAAGKGLQWEGRATDPLQRRAR